MLLYLWIDSNTINVEGRTTMTDKAQKTLDSLLPWFVAVLIAFSFCFWVKACTDMHVFSIEKTGRLHEMNK